MTDKFNGAKGVQDRFQERQTVMIEEPMQFGAGINMTIGDRVWVIEHDGFGGKKYREAIHTDILWSRCYFDSTPKLLGAGVVVDLDLLTPHVIVKWKRPSDYNQQDS